MSKEFNYLNEIKSIDPPINIDIINDFNKIEQNDLEDIEKKLKNETDIIKSRCINIKGDINNTKNLIEKIKNEIELDEINYSNN